MVWRIGGARRRRAAGVWGWAARARASVVAAVGLAVVLTLPSLHAGLYADDYYQRWLLLRHEAYAEVRPPPMEMFTFFDGDAARTQRMKQLGLLPWWMYDGVRARFWRPLTALTHIADYQFWPGRVEWMHAQSIAWYAALVLIVAMFYRQVMGRTAAAALAAVMFAVDDAHTIPAGWIASRNALIATAFGVLALVCHRRWRREAQRQRPRGRRIAFMLMAVGFVAAALLSAEVGIATFGYLIAYELVLDRGRWMRRTAALLPYVVVIVAWRALWVWQGYGVHALDSLYIDPAARPLAFIGAAVVRAPILLLGQSAYPPADVGVVVDGAGRAFFALCGVVAVALSVWMLWRLLRYNRAARFWLVGLLLSAIPLCSPAPSNRMLLFIGIGAFGLGGQFLAMALHARFWQNLSRARRLGRFSFVSATVVIHLIAAPALLFFLSHWPLGVPEMWHAMQELPDVTRQDARRDLIIVNHPLALNMVETLVSRACDGRPVPRSTTVLAPSGSAVLVRRVDERTLVLRVERGYFPDPFSRVFYSAEAADTRIELPAVEVTVLESSHDSGPREVRFRFNAPLDDASALRWMCWRGGGYQPFTPPAVGQSVELPRAGFPF